ncbi:methyltransferase domain-containing protein [Candidatus Nitrosotenuis chungbukensis]|uniref:class I SAM-dependent methyltransferase n=1 Tax=Candidatus Nitrosotenuis chungbukensis TaxID=1353246 RepID=UPI0012FE90A2|nr:methyltransferase domain-containing protein [Candidatus Nitrosotenuis chungbukensis]WKT58338.1 methyltransferase domain-containing protein [Candidatus Nitrosotenuis chungbukensis]
MQENEIKTIVSLLPNSKLKILEIGGGDGIKSMLLHNLGYDMTCVDINPWEKQFYPVLKIERNRLPFTSKAFDVVLSANVLPVVSEKKQFFDEIDRVLKNDGIIIHVVPSHWWSIFTNFWHYVFIPKYLMRSILPKKTTSVIPETHNSLHVQDNTRTSSKIRRLFSHPLGDNPSFLHEIFYFTKNSWIALFKLHGYSIVEIKNEPLFFTAYGVFMSKYFKSRRILGRVFPIQYYFKIMKNSDKT